MDTTSLKPCKHKRLASDLNLYEQRQSYPLYNMGLSHKSGIYTRIPYRHHKQRKLNNVSSMNYKCL